MKLPDLETAVKEYYNAFMQVANQYYLYAIIICGVVFLAVLLLLVYLLLRSISM